MVNQMLNLLKTRNLKAANGQPINIIWEITAAEAATLTLAISRMNIRKERVLTINRAYLPLVRLSNSHNSKQLQIWWIKSKVYRRQCKIKASSSRNNSPGTNSRGVLNSLTHTAIHSLSNSTILKTNKSISIKARLIRHLVTSVLMQFHIHNINIKHLFSNLIRNNPNQFSRGNSAKATISSRTPQARLSKLLIGTTLTGVALILVRSTWVSHACS